MRKDMIFLKLGGSLITDKAQTETALTDRISFLLEDLKTYQLEHPHTMLLLGHGSGSFGHHAAAKHKTRDGIYDAAGRDGFMEVWRSARKLNEIILDIGQHLGLRLVAFPPSAGLLSADRIVQSWEVEPIYRAMDAGLIPVVYGDVVFDQVLGGTIFSTEELFSHLADKFSPDRVLLAGLEAAVYADFPNNTQPIQHIGKDQALDDSLRASAHADVTGGMRSKVLQMQALCRHSNNCQVEIFTAQAPGELLCTLNGLHSGTIIS